MRVSQHSGRTGTANHNGRNFDISKADHIDPNRVGLNKVLSRGEGETLKEKEIDVYMKLFEASNKAKNERYIQQRHKERCKSIEDLYQGKLTRPEELILQIGGKDDHIDHDLFETCVAEYVRTLNSWNKEHGKPFTILSISFHFDETSPHVHLRRVWHYEKDGMCHLGQNKALEQAGVPLPHPEEKISRYNNRKMTFDAEMRDKWIDICKSKGLEIEREPRPSVRHKEKADYITDKINQDIESLVDYKNKHLEDLMRVMPKEKRMVMALQKSYPELYQEFENKIREQERGSNSRDR